MIARLREVSSAHSYINRFRHRGRAAHLKRQVVLGRCFTSASQAKRFSVCMYQLGERLATVLFLPALSYSGPINDGNS